MTLTCHRDVIREKEVGQLPNEDVMEVMYTGDRLRLSFIYSLRGYKESSVRPPCGDCCEDYKCALCRMDDKDDE